MILLFGITITVMLSQNLEVSAMKGSVKKYTLVARNVRSVRTIHTDVFLSQKKNKVMQVDLFKKLKNKDVRSNIYYKNCLISKNAKAYFPDGARIFIQNNRDEILFTGEEYAKCESIFGHKTKKDCERDKAAVANEVVLKNITRCWSDFGLFAYVKNKSLVVTGTAIAGDVARCYHLGTKATCFKGQADQVKQVVSGELNVFVLMKNGSVWGTGWNETMLISDSEEYYYGDFVQIIPQGVKAIAATGYNVGMLKEDGSLWIWGGGGRAGYAPPTTPYKIADNVKEFSLCTDWRSPKSATDFILVFIKKNNTAYGMGSNYGYALTSKYKKGWIDNPVKLKSNIKHVYTGYGTTFLLDKEKRLYWSGGQFRGGLMDIKAMK